MRFLPSLAYITISLGIISSCDQNNNVVLSAKEPPTPNSPLVLKTQFFQQYNTNIHYLFFNQNDYDFSILEQEKKSREQWQSIESIASKHKVTASINGGFFTPEGNPLGVSIINSNKSGSLNYSSIGSGAFIVNRNNIPNLIRRNKISSYKNPKYLIQSGPFLIENGKPIKVKQSEPRPRSFIANDASGNWLIAMVENISLNDLIKLLNEEKIAQFNIKNALNLDGGRSSQIYYHDKLKNNPKMISAFMHRKVKNFICVKHNKP